MKENQTFDHLAQKLSSVISHQQENYLYFGGTAYLGIPQNKAFIDLYIKGIAFYGLNNGTSRGNNVQLGIYNEAESYTAKRFGAEAALITSSGYLAAQLTVKVCVTQGEVRYAPNTHPALWTNGNPAVQSSFEEWSKQVVAEINASETPNWVLLTNSMNNLHPEIYDFSFIKEINSSKKVTLVIDDSHGIGLLNQGNCVLQNVPNIAHVGVVVVASMAKALGLDAGVVLGSRNVIAQLKRSDEFYGASPPAAAGLYAFIHANEIYGQAFEKLQENVKIFKETLINKQDWLFAGDFPVFLALKSGIEKSLLANQILISSFPYPDRNSENLNRIVLSSWHSKADVLKLAAVL